MKSIIRKIMELYGSNKILQKALLVSILCFLILLSQNQYVSEVQDNEILIQTYTAQSFHLPHLSISIEDLPTQLIQIILEGSSFGPTIQADLYFGFEEFSSEFRNNYLGIGFRADYLTVMNNFIASPVVGLGYPECREYSFIYLDGENETPYDHWIANDPGFTMMRNYPAWTESNRNNPCAIYTSRPGFSLENISNVSHAGEILEFENLIVYFSDGSSFICGPQIITVRANFTQDNGAWHTDIIINATDNEGVTIEDNTIRVSLRGEVPINLVNVGFLITTPFAIFILAIVYRRRKKAIGQPEIS